MTADYILQPYILSPDVYKRQDLLSPSIPRRKPGVYVYRMELYRRELVLFRDKAGKREGDALCKSENAGWVSGGCIRSMGAVIAGTYLNIRNEI